MFSSSKAFSGLRAAPKKTVKPASFQVIKPSDRAGQALVKVSFSTQQGKDQRFTSQLATPWGKWGQMGALFAVAYGSYLLTEEDDKKKRNASFLDQFLPSAEAQTAVEPPSEKLAQPTVVTGNLNNGGFLIVHLNDGVDLRKVALAAAKLPDIAAEVAGGDTLYAGIAFGTQTWDQIAKQNKLGSPQNLKHFKTKVGKHGSMPATGGDILVHVKAKTQSQCWEVFQEFLKTLPPGSVASIDDEYGWHYQEGRDLSGFIDGTENVADLKEKRAAALLQTGGSYVIHQRWHHDLKGFHAKPEGEQEAIIGRSKPDSARLEKLSPTSHVARSRTDSDTQIPIVRQSMPFGSLKGPHGLLFIAYANDPSRFDTLLDRMTGNSGGLHNDAIMTFSKCIKSQYYYVPSIKELKSFA